MTSRRFIASALLALGFVFPLPGSAAQQRLTVDEIVAQHPVSGTAPSAFSWSPNGSAYVYSVPGARENDAPVLYVHEMRSGRNRLLFAAKTQARGSRSRAIGQIVWSGDGTRIAFLNGGKLEIARADGSGEVALADDADDPQWAPGDRRIAYVHSNDLYVVDIASRRRVRLTFGGSAARIHGDPDWLYSEEMGVQHAYRFSPDGASIAYLSFDESRVTDFPIQDFLRPVNDVEMQRYPLAGGRNPQVSLHVVQLSDRASRVLYDGAPLDEYVLSFVWTPDSRAIVDEIVDRAQRNVRLEAFARDGSSARTVVRESDAQFVDVQDAPVFLRDGKSFVWLSERDGVQALYRVDYASGAVRRLSGEYPVAQVLRVDERAGAVYASAFYPTRRDRALVRIPLDGGATVNVTPGAGSHVVTMPEGTGDEFIETYSSFNTPPAIVRRSLDGRARSVIFRTPDLSRFDLGTTRRLEIPSSFGTLDAQLTVPANFDATKRYPVVVVAYGGPLPVSAGVTTSDRWLGLFPQVLAQHGFLVFSVDGPASNNDRAGNARLFYRSMGNIAMAGQLAGVEWLRKQPYVDASRLGLYGWSYGGYLTAFTLTHAPGVFRSGIAGGPPADFRFYDSAYTERYMGAPQRERASYASASVLPQASHLRGMLLIVQGTSDDNVHLMNSMQLLEAFVQAGKQVQYFVYPGARHGVTGIAALRNLDTRMLAWWEGTLK